MLLRVEPVFRCFLLSKYPGSICNHRQLQAGSTCKQGNQAELHRLNVAISGARCLSIVVGSPGLASGVANTVAEAEQINRLCEVMG